MSMFNPATAPCPACGTVHRFQLVASVNADRRDDLRRAILDGSFQRETCENCGMAFVAPPALTYLDVGRGQYILVQPLAFQEHWEASSEMAHQSFETAYGAKANATAQQIGEQLDLRIVFGWAALREKLRCAELKIDDVDLELLKLALIRQSAESPLSDTTELRLLGTIEKDLRLAWIDGPTERAIEQFQVPRAAYDEIAADTKTWGELREEMAADPFVDVNRMLLAPAAA